MTKKKTSKNKEIKEERNKNPYEKESHSEKFVRIAPKRIENVLKAFQKLQNLSNTGSYKFNPGQVKKMKELIEGGLKECFDSFEIKKRKKIETKIDSQILIQDL
jgi:hypothetical protein